MINYEIKLDDVTIEKNSCDFVVFEKLIGRFTLMAFSVSKRNDSIMFFVEDRTKPLGNLSYDESIYEIKWTDEKGKL